MSINHALLFVCAGNTCRSPAAVQILAACLVRHGLDPQTWRIDSAGLRAVRGQPASALMISTLWLRGLDLSAHRSKTIQDLDLSQVALVLVMEPEHRRDLLVRFPSIGGRVFLLSEMSGEAGGVEDPFGGDGQAYEQTALQIENLIERGFSRIFELSAIKDGTGGNC
jgi:protein-tyrosine-phosphatase